MTPHRRPRYLERQVRRTLTALTVLGGLGRAAGAQRGATPTAPPPKPLDRTVVPTPAKEPEVRLPTWSRATLSNGAQLVVSERHGLPLVSFTVNFIGGANQFEAPNKTGTAGFVAGMLG